MSPLRLAGARGTKLTQLTTVQGVNYINLGEKRRWTN